MAPVCVCVCVSALVFCECVAQKSVCRSCEFAQSCSWMSEKFPSESGQRMCCCLEEECCVSRFEPGTGTFTLIAVYVSSCDSTGFWFPFRDVSLAGFHRKPVSLMGSWDPRPEP